MKDHRGPKYEKNNVLVQARSEYSRQRRPTWPCSLYAQIALALTILELDTGGAGTRLGNGAGAGVGSDTGATTGTDA